MVHRPRRLRSSEGIRRMVRETQVTVDNLVYPLFVTEGSNIKNEIASLPDQYHLSVDRLEAEIESLKTLGINGIILFGLPDKKDETGSEAYDENGIIQRAVREIRRVDSNINIITDVCLCAYTSHGHCGIIKDNRIDNDLSVEQMVKVALSHARAGADIIAPSDMMDGRVSAIRTALDHEDFTDVPIMSYSAKYASAFYGPFRQAAQSSPRFGDRRSYQMDYANADEALREVELDIQEGADMIMIKPALAYLDIIRNVRERYPVPIAAYNVSGEYAMVKAAAAKGWINEESIMLEMLTSIKRAGAQIIITYFARDFATLIKYRGDLI